MRMEICSIFDKKTGLYGGPVCVVHVGDAVREFDHLRKDKNTKYGMNPEDFDLMRIGTFDTSLGKFENSQVETLLAGV